MGPGPGFPQTPAKVQSGSQGPDASHGQELGGNREVNKSAPTHYPHKETFGVGDTMVRDGKALPYPSDITCSAEMDGYIPRSGRSITCWPGCHTIKAYWPPPLINGGRAFYTVMGTGFPSGFCEGDLIMWLKDFGTILGFWLNRGDHLSDQMTDGTFMVKFALSEVAQTAVEGSQRNVRLGKAGYPVISAGGTSHIELKWAKCEVILPSDRVGDPRREGGPRWERFGEFDPDIMSADKWLNNKLRIDMAKMWAR